MDTGRETTNDSSRFLPSRPNPHAAARYPSDHRRVDIGVWVQHATRRSICTLPQPRDTEQTEAGHWHQALWADGKSTRRLRRGFGRRPYRHGRMALQAVQAACEEILRKAKFTSACSDGPQTGPACLTACSRPLGRQASSASPFFYRRPLRTGFRLGIGQRQQGEGLEEC